MNGNMAAIEVTGVSKTYHDQATGRVVRTLDNVSIAAKHNDFLVLLGPSGCGKSTLLNIIAGLVSYDADGGTVMVEGKPVTGPEFRDGYEALDITDDKLKEIGILGMSAPFKLSCAKHDGSERFRMMQWDGSKFVLLTDWVPAPNPAFIRKLIEESAEKYAKENNLPVRQCS